MKTVIFAALMAAALPGIALAGDVELVDGFVRATPPGAAAGGAFVTLANISAVDHRLIAAATDVANDVQLHTHIMDDAGVMRMREVKGGIALPAGETVAMQPGGLHIMLIGLNTQLIQGSDIDLTLQFEDGSVLPTTLPVKSIAAGHGHKSHGHGMSHGTKMQHDGHGHMSN